MSGPAECMLPRAGVWALNKKASLFLFRYLQSCVDTVLILFSGKGSLRKVCVLQTEGVQRDISLAYW